MKGFFAVEVIEEKPKKVRNRGNQKKKNPEGPPYAEGRECAHPGCITILNTYHNGPFCSLHEGAEYERKMTEKIIAYNQK